MSPEAISRHAARHRIWLQPPATGVSLNPKLAGTARRAITLLRQAALAAPNAVSAVLTGEAYASSLIENIDADPSQSDSPSARLHHALLDCQEQPEPERILEWHRILFAGHPASWLTPGQWRRVNVVVGDWRPPTHAAVPALMAEFFEWLRQEPDPLLKAVWGHRWFETIHPFADGNGRTGRMLFQALLGVPLTVSCQLWRERGEYYRLLATGDWDDWQHWLLVQIRAGAYQAARELRRPPDAAEAPYDQARRLAAPPYRPSELKKALAEVDTALITELWDWHRR